MKRLKVFKDIWRCGYPIVAIKYLINPKNKLFRIEGYQYINSKKVHAHEILFEYCVAIFIDMYYSWFDDINIIMKYHKDYSVIHPVSLMLLDRLTFDYLNIGYDHVIEGIRNLNYPAIFDSSIDIFQKFCK